jgi:hypothetical protein
MYEAIATRHCGGLAHRSSDGIEVALFWVWGAEFGSWRSAFVLSMWTTSTTARRREVR